MIYTEEQQREYDDAVYLEHRTQSEVISDSVHDYVMVRGSQNPGAYWICSNYDTWETNPHFIANTAADRFHMKYEHPEHDYMSNDEHLEFRALWIAAEQDAESGRYEVTS